MIQYVTPEGELTETGAWIWDALTLDERIDFWRWLVRIRLYDQQCMIWQKQGRVMNYPPFYGQEAVQVGSVLALRTEDWLFPTYRDHGAALVKGWPLDRSLLYWRGRPEAHQVDRSLRLLPAAVPIATHLLHAVGTAWAMKRQKESAVVLVFFGDGATSEGDFHEACNLASLQKVPVIFLCQNNGYAISHPFSRQSATATVSEKAAAYDLRSVRVDGNDVLAVFDVTRKAAQRARRGEGPTLIEAVTYRLGPHTMSDDPSKYRPASEVEEWQRKEPLKRWQQLLLQQGLISEKKIDAFKNRCRKELQQAWQTCAQTPAPVSDQLFAHVFARLPETLCQQRMEARREEENHAFL